MVKTKGIKMGKLKGKITEVRFDATFNKGNYESEKIGVTYQSEETEDVFEVIEELRKTVREEKGACKVDEEETASVEVARKQHTSSVEEKVEEVKEEVKKAKKPKAEKAAKVEAVLYDRENPLHKKLLVACLDAKVPTWKSAGKASKAAEVSKALSGKELFLDPKGEVLESFVTLFISSL